MLDILPLYSWVSHHLQSQRNSQLFKNITLSNYLNKMFLDINMLEMFRLSFFFMRCILSLISPQQFSRTESISKKKEDITEQGVLLIPPNGSHNPRKCWIILCTANELQENIAVDQIYRFVDTSISFPQSSEKAH